jgi:hypothetical protein
MAIARLIKLQAAGDQSACMRRAEGPLPHGGIRSYLNRRFGEISIRSTARSQPEALAEQTLTRRIIRQSRQNPHGQSPRGCIGRMPVLIPHRDVSGLTGTGYWGSGHNFDGPAAVSPAHLPRCLWGKGYKSRGRRSSGTCCRAVGGFDLPRGAGTVLDGTMTPESIDRL